MFLALNNNIISSLTKLLLHCFKGKLLCIYHNCLICDYCFVFQAEEEEERRRAEEAASIRLPEIPLPQSGKRLYLLNPGGNLLFVYMHKCIFTYLVENADKYWPEVIQLDMLCDNLG